MTNNILWRILFPGILLLILLASGCVKQRVPLYYHTLNSPKQAPVSASINDLPPILVGPIRVASFLDQQQLVRQRTSHSVSLIEQHRWAGNLPEMLSNTLITLLTQQLGSEKVYSFPDTRTEGGLRLELDFLHFEEDQDRMAFLEVRWRIVSENKQAILHAATSRYQITPETRDYDGLVQGLSQGITHLSLEISTKFLLLSSSTERKSSC